MKYVHTNIITHDWKGLAGFYQKVFECIIVPPIRKQKGDWLSKGTGVANAELEGAHLLLPGWGQYGPTLEIYQYANTIDQESVSPNQKGYGHMAFEVEDVGLVVEQVEFNGGSKCGELTTRTIPGIGEITFIYVRDPDGNLIELQRWNYE